MGKRRFRSNGNTFFMDGSCHSGPVEIMKNLFCGSEVESFAMAAQPNRVDTLIPLYAMDARIWETGFRGEVLYYPISDFGILPDDIMKSLAAKIIERLRQNKKVGIFCLGGHGRTGYVASIVLGMLGAKDPIAYLRQHYCNCAVESNAQIEHIAKILQKPELVSKYTVIREYRTYWDEFGNYDFLLHDD